MKKLLLGLVLLCTPATAQDIQGKTLWNNLTTGMSKAEVKALYPQKGLSWPRITLTDQCYGELAFNYEEGKLSKVIMVWSNKDKGPCADIIEKTLIEKYGQPTSEERGQRKDIMECKEKSGIAASICRASLDEYKIVKLWVNADGVQMRLRRYNGVDANWKIEWTVATTGDAQAASKL